MIEHLQKKLAVKSELQIKSVCFRLPAGDRLEDLFYKGLCCFYVKQDVILSFKQVLYQYIFCCGQVNSNFGIFTIYPRRMIKFVGSDLIGDIDSVLRVEEDENFPDPLQYLKDEV